MAADEFEKLIRVARRAEIEQSEVPPLFFGHRIAAQWMARRQEQPRSIWEPLALRGVAVAVMVTIAAIALQAFAVPDNDFDPATQFSAEIFSLP